MKLAALFSGGKDSTYAIYRSRLDGHTVECLITVFPRSEESHLLHHPNIESTRLQARSMGIPQITVSADSDETRAELAELRKALESAQKNFGIQGITHGGIRSVFQRENFGSVCSALGLEVISPLWGTDEAYYMRDLVKSGFRFIITSVTAGGLDDSWLGKEVTASDVERLVSISSRYGINLSFEGGEAETFVLDCPIFSRPIRVTKSSRTWDGYRGRFEITEAVLEERC